MCGWHSIATEEFEEDEEYRGLLDITGQHISFYAPCTHDSKSGVTNWCKKHCLQNRYPFPEERRRSFVQHIGDADPFFDEDFYQGAKYATIFASGCGETEFSDWNWKQGISIRKVNDGRSYKSSLLAFWSYVANINKTTKFRFFTRDIVTVQEYTKTHPNQIAIASVDCGSTYKFIETVIANQDISMAIVDHPDNKGLIALAKLLYQINHVEIIKCADCNSCAEGEQECSGDFLCFQGDNRKLIIMNYK